MQISQSSRLILLSVFAFNNLVFFSSTLQAQALEEIIVTSQKRAESLQDVSVSVTALSGEKLADGAIARLEEVTAFVPNFTLSETGIGTNIYIRGIGSGINQGFEQSVGMYFDGIYYGRAQLARSPIFDLERLEVLKGPQVTLFGNNSIGGAVSINSAKPTDYFEGSVKLMHSPGHGEDEVNLVLSGPLKDNLNARLAIRKYDMDGYMFNENRNRNEPNRDYLTTRLSFQFTPDSDAFEVNLKLEHSKFNVEGRQIAIIRDEATNYTGTTNLALVSDPDFGGNPFIGQDSWETPSSVNISDYTLPGGGIDFAAFNDAIAAEGDRTRFFGPAPNLAEIFSTGLSIEAAEAGGYENGLIYQKNAGQDVAYPYELEKRGSNNDYSKNAIDSIALNVDLPLEYGDLKFISGYLNYGYDELCDCDFTAADLIEYQSNEAYEQFSQEIRYTSSTGDFIDFIVGAYYQKDQLDFIDYVAILEDSALEETLSFIFKEADEESISDLVGVSTPRNFNVDSELFAAFGQATLHFSDSTRLILGLRESKVIKTGARELNYAEQDLTTALDEERWDRINYIFNIALRVNPHNSVSKRKEKRTSWAAIIEQDINEDYMLYLSAVNGFKGGGFDTRSNNPNNVNNLADKEGRRLNDGIVPANFSVGTFEFEDEEALAYELGLKARIGDRAEINTAYFYTDIEGLQLSVFDGGVGFNVSNAGQATTQGLEIESRFSLSENWLLTASLAWMQFEYKDYTDGLCTSSDLLVMNDRVAPNYLVKDETTQPLNCKLVFIPVPGSDSQIETPQADLTGETNQYVANYSGALSLEYQNNINDKLLFKGGIDINFTDEYNTAQNLDPALQQDGYEVYNIRLALIDNVSEKWEIALIGRNITDEKIISYANDVPLSTNLFGTKTSYGFVQRTESWALQGKYNF
jgi:iron complex outermembrane recepter protein